jgi:Haem-dependent oxidative N-demethylase, alpha subunit-like
VRLTQPAGELPFTLPFAEESRHEEFRWRLGLHPLDPRDWIDLGPTGEAAIAAKAELLATHPDVVLAWLDDVQDEAAEVADALVDHLRRRWPERPPPRLATDRHPLDAAGRLVPEDLVLLVPRDGRLVVGGGSVCFPNRWDLGSKLGRTLAGTHAPVPRLNEQLGARLDRFLDRLTPERGFWRLGWGIIDTPAWHTPPGRREPTPAEDGPPAEPTTGKDGWYLRVERETIRRFPRTGAVLFTIRTHVSPVDALVDHGDAAPRLATRLAQMPADVRSYKGIAAVADELVAALRR